MSGACIRIDWRRGGTMQDETISVGPYVLKREDGAALLAAIRWSPLAIAHGWFVFILRIAGFVFLGYVISRVVLTSLYMSASEFHQLRALPITAAGLVAAAYELLIHPYLRSAFVSRQRFDKRPQTVVISSTGALCDEGDIRTSIPWREVDRVVITPRHIMLFISQVQAVLIPMRAFGSPAAAATFGESALRWHRAARSQ